VNGLRWQAQQGSVWVDVTTKEPARKHAQDCVTQTRTTINVVTVSTARLTQTARRPTFDVTVYTTISSYRTHLNARASTSDQVIQQRHAIIENFHQKMLAHLGRRKPTSKIQWELPSKTV
jgi:hypothetical protein